MHTYHPIDLQNWERRDIYEHFSRLKTPHYAVAATIDVTRLLEYKRQHRLSFYLSLIYLATQALNGLEAFRMRIKDGKPVVYDRIHTNFTHKRPDEQVFHFYTAPFEGSLHEYVAATSLAIAEQTTLFAGMAPLQNVVYYSCAPTLDATAITNPGLDSPDDARSIRACIDQQFFKDYATDNVIAKVEGQRHDSCYIFTAHYDHLGNLGRKVFYGGANDNASGTAAIITLARHYAEHRPRFDTYFIAFSGEDAYLRGSRWYVDHPVVPLERIKYLFNIDMIGDNNPVLHCEPSDAGAWAMPVLEQLNSRGHYFQALKRAPLEEKSDHYPFAVRGVPCIFFENEEGDAFPFYHTPQDDWKHVRHDTYEPLFRLITEFL